MSDTFNILASDPTRDVLMHADGYLHSLTSMPSSMMSLTSDLRGMCDCNHSQHLQDCSSFNIESIPPIRTCLTAHKLE